MSRILITGGAGFLGSSLAEGLLKDPTNDIVLLDNLLTGDLRKIPGNDRCKFVQCDVNDRNALTSVMTNHPFDYVFHYAAVVGVKRTLENPVSVLNDIDGIRNFLDLSAKTGVRRVFYCSSSEVYGEPVHLPQNEETTPLNSRLPYAVVKNLGESYCRSYQREFGLSYTILRFFNTYGPKQSNDFVISKFLRKALRNEPITIFGKGNQTRTFCFVHDNVDTVIACLTRDQHINDVINIGNDQEMTILELANKILAVTQSSSEIQFLPALKEGDMTRRLPDNTKMRELLQRDLVPLEAGLQRMLADPLFKSLSDLP
ncbi:MAG: NAD-dependent epimerase/dehydratase family protein [Cyclobacteriaceae bacterium]|nr:NAD-dependent epimerase/dehydratase family protein [Cyclobacteriaceae bacterium]